MRYRVSNHEVPHLWANQAQSHANGNSIHFSGPDILSYATVVGRIVTNERNEKMYLLTNRTYSITTSGHMSHIRRAVPVGETVLYVDNVYATPQDLLIDILSQIEEAQGKADRARKYKDCHLTRVSDLVNDARALSEFYDLPLPEGFTPETAAGLSADAIAEITRARREAEEARREAQEAEDRATRERYTAYHRADIEAWLSGGEMRFNAYLTTSAYMRVEGQEVVTSQGARVPLDHVKKVKRFLLAAIKKATATKEPVKPEGTLRVGHYTVRGVEPSGVVIVGCHTFSPEEVTRFAALV